MKLVSHKIAPTLTRIIEIVGKSNESWAKSKSTKSKNWAIVGTKPCFHLYDNQLRTLPGITYCIIMVQLHYLHSMYSAKLPVCPGLQAWSSGTSQQMISVLHRSCLSVLYPSIAALVHSLAEHSIKRAQAVSLLPHVLAYDNVKISSLIFVEQRPNTMSKVQSGTFAIIYSMSSLVLVQGHACPFYDNKPSVLDCISSSLGHHYWGGQFQWELSGTWWWLSWSAEVFSGWAQQHCYSLFQQPVDKCSYCGGQYLHKDDLTCRE